MEQYKKEFIEFMVESNVLKFGEFTLKSGRKSPFFMNAGAYVTGSQLKRLGEYYAKAIHDAYGLDFDVLFGPAYKGIPLAVVTAMAFSELYGKEVRYCSDRKEEKDHGADKGSLLGYKINDGDRVVIIEDVTTSGKSIEETYPKIKEFLDRTVAEAKEKGVTKTLYGRIRPIPELSSSNYMQRQFGERVAMNAPIQGTAADIIKIAMIRVHDRLIRENYKSRLILQVHDELLIETAEEEKDAVIALLEQEMQSAADLSVELAVGTETGYDWYDAH